MHDKFFNNKKPDFQRLLDFGFFPVSGGYSYSKPIVDGQFNLVMTISDEGIIHTDVIEVATKETYVLHHVHGAFGAFIGRIREEYASILATIAEKCFARDVFKSDYTKRVLEYVWNTYADEPEYLWEKFPRTAIFRRKDNAKWYAVLLALPASKIGLADDNVVEIIDLRIDTEKIDSLVDKSRYFPGYHMNKKHWFTMCLDGSVPIDEVFQWIDASYGLAKKR